MINSIRWRLFIGMTLLIGFFVFFSWLLNTNYLEKYYVHEKTTQLSKQSQYIIKLFTEAPEDMLVQLRILERRENLTILVIQPDLNIIYASINTDSGVTEFDIVLEPVSYTHLILVFRQYTLPPVTADGIVQFSTD